MSGKNDNSSRETISRSKKAKEAGQAALANLDLSVQKGFDITPKLAKIILLQQAIAVGSYVVPASVLAEKMVDDLILKTKQRSEMS